MKYLYDVISFNVTDVDECENEASNMCPYGSECLNTNGSYECPCIEGFNATGDGHCEGNIAIMESLFCRATFSF